MNRTTADHLLDTTCAMALVEPLAADSDCAPELLARVLMAHHAGLENDITRMVEITPRALRHELFGHHMATLRALAQDTDTSSIDQVGWEWSAPLQRAGEALAAILSVHEDTDLTECDTVALAAIVRHLLAVMDSVVPAHMDEDDILAAEGPIIAEITGRAIGARRDPAAYARHGVNALQYSRAIADLSELAESRDWTLCPDQEVVERFVPLVLDLDVTLRLLPVEPR